MYDIIQKQNKVYIVEGENLVEKYDTFDDINSIEGNIYVGKIGNILKGMKMAFVDIGKEKNGILSLSDFSKIYNDKEINKVLKPGNKVVVQVKRDEIDSKGVKLTTDISLVGKYIVFFPYNNFVTVSLKMDNIDERNRLVKIVREILPKNTGAIIRTEAKWKNQLELQEDMQVILNKWKNIRSKIEQNETVPNVIYQNTEMLEKIITNITPQNINKIITDDIDTLDKYKNLLTVVYQEKFDLVDNVRKQLETSWSRKVWLDSGAYITIDKTEALTAVDVNSAKYVGKKSAEDTFFNVNKEATYEVAKQIRLRNISGMIIIDYINMENELHKMEILKLLKEEVKKDRSKTEILGFTKLNLLEMTRQHLNG